MVKVFVYGTLLRGESNHHWLRDAKLIAEKAHVAGVLADTGMGYPGLLPAEAPDQAVIGEVYETDAVGLSQLDELEDYFGPGDPRNLYERIAVNAHAAGGVLEVWTYLYVHKEPGLVAIPNGDWRGYRQMKEKSWQGS